MAMSVFIISFVKPVAIKLTSDVMIRFVVENLLPKVFDIMADGAPHILNITQQIQAGVNLYILIKQKWRGSFYFKNAELHRKYFKNILQAIESTEKTNLKEQLNEAMHNPDPVAKSGMLSQVKLEQQQLDIIKDLMEVANK